MVPELIPTDQGAKLIANQKIAGCYIYLIATFIVVLILSLIFLIPHTTLIKATIGIFLITFAIIFFGVGVGILMMKKKKVLITIENGYIKNDKQSVALSEVIDISYGWHPDKLSGGIFEDLIVTTSNNKKYYFSYYNIVSEEAIQQLIKEYILPNAHPICIENWEARQKKHSNH